MNQIIVHLFDPPEKIFEKIFSNEKTEISIKNYGKIEIRFFSHNKSILSFFSSSKTINWIGYKYPNITDNNANEILKDFTTSLKTSVNKKNVIINFGYKYIKAFRKMSNNLDADHPFILFNLSENDEIEKDFFQKFKNPQYISYIKDKYNPEKPDLNLHKILSYIWEKDCYYNERGNSSCAFSPANLLYKPSKGFLFCNILLIGESRAGKSTLINRMFKKYVTFETSKYESATKEITEYELNWPDNSDENSKNSLVKNGYGLIRILDSPGIVKTENLDASSKIIDEIDKKFDIIHMIYFFIKGQSNIELGIEVLKYIKKKNLAREKKNLFKVPIIFIKNGEDLSYEGNGNVLFQELKNFLSKNDLLDLYDSFGKKSKKSINDMNFLSDEEDNENINSYQNYLDGNIIQIHLPTGKNLNQLFSLSKKYIVKNNSNILEGKLDNEYNIMKNNANTLIKFYIKNKLEKKSLTKRENDLYEKLYKECNEFSLKLEKSGSILYNLDILKVKTDPTGYMIGYFVSGMLSVFLIPFFIAVICLYKVYNNVLSYIAASFGFSEEDIKHYGLDKYILNEEFLKDVPKDNEKATQKIRKFFKDIIYYIGPIQCAIKTREALMQINEMLEKLSNVKDEEWNKFNVEKI